MSGFTFGGFETTKKFASDDELASVLAQMKEQKTAFRAEIERLGRALANATKAEHVAREALAECRQSYFDERNEALRAKQQARDEGKKAMDAYDRGVQLEEEVKQKQDLIDQQRRSLSELQNAYDNATAHLKEQENQVALKDRELATLRNSVNQLKQDVEHELQANNNLASELEQAHIAIRNAETHRDAAVRARDEALEHYQVLQNQFNSLHNDIEGLQQHIIHLEEQGHQADELAASYRVLEVEMDNVRAQLEDRERTLFVKDERISQLESQFQKERQRHLHAADAAAALRTATASPVDEPPEPFIAFGDSLEEELNAASDYEESIYEHLDFSDVTEVIDFEPTTGSLPLSTIHIGEAASVTPVPAPIQSLTTSFNEIANIAPIQRQVINISTFTQTDLPVNTTISTQTDVPELTFEILHNATFDITPIAPVEIATTHTTTQTDAPKLTVSIVDAATVEITPIEAWEVVPEIVQTPASTQKIEIAPIKVTFEDQPIAPPVAQTITIAPIEATFEEQPIALPLAQTIEIAPIEVTFEEQPVAPPVAQTIEIAPVVMTFEEQPIVPPVVQTVAHPIAQTVEVTPIQVTFEEHPVAPALVQTSEQQPREIIMPQLTKKKAPISQAILSVLTGLLFVLCFSLYVELHSWRVANGVGFGNGYGNVYDRGGAYGNGRHVLGVPLAMGIGNSNFSENIARVTSDWITLVEGWAGISQRVLY